MGMDKNPYRRFLPAQSVVERFFPPDLDMPPELWPASRMRDYQGQRIAALLRHAYANNDFYRDSFKAASVHPDDFKELDDLAKFPFLEKDSLRGQPWKLLSVPRSEINQIHVSTGTTSSSIGDHIYSLFSWEDIYLDELAINMPIQVPADQGDVVFIALPYEMSSAGISFHRYFQHNCQAAVVNVGKGGFYADPHKTLLMMRDLGVDVVVTTPSYLMHLAEVAVEHGLGPGLDLRPRLVWLTGEGCSDAYRRRLESIWSTTCHMYYGSLECGPLGNECLLHEGYHLPQGHIYLEIIDPDTGEVLPEGSQGEICVTVLYRNAMPLIRYRVQDMGYLDLADCPCCNQFPRLFLRGRVQDQLEIEGVRVAPVRLEEILYSLPEMGNSHQFRVKRRADGGQELSVVVETPTGVAPDPEVAEMIRSRLEVLAGSVASVEQVAKIPASGGKTTRVIWVKED